MVHLEALKTLTITHAPLVCFNSAIFNIALTYHQAQTSVDSVEEAREEFHDAAEDDIGLDMQTTRHFSNLKLKSRASPKHRFSRSISDCTEVNPRI